MAMLTEMKREHDRQLESLKTLEDTNKNLFNDIVQLQNTILKQKDEIAELKNDRDHHFLKISNLERVAGVKPESAGVNNLFKNHQVI